MKTNTFNLNKCSEKVINNYIKHDLLDVKIDPYGNYPIYDGDLMVYKKPNGSSEDFRPIRIQIKGTTSAKRSFKVKRKEAEAYFDENGIIFFTVFFEKIDKNNFDENKYIITYNALTKNTIKNLLARIKGKTIELKMKTIPEDINEFYKICSNFLIDKSLQTNYVDCGEFLKDKSIKTITMKSIVTSKTEDAVNEMLLDNLKYPRTLIVKFEDDTEQILSDVKLFFVGQSTTNKIKVGEIIYYNSANLITKENETFLVVGKSIRINIKPKFEILFNLEGNIDEYLKDVKFLEDAFNNGGFELNNKFCTLNCDEELSNHLKAKYSQLLKIKEVIEKLGYNDNIYPNDISQEEYKEISLLYNKKVIPGIYKINVNKKTALIVVNEDRSFISAFSSSDVLKSTVKMDNGKILENASPYITMSYSDIVCFKNINYDTITKSVCAQPYNEDIGYITNNFALTLIKYYDNFKGANVLKCAKDILDWLYKQEPLSHIRINQLQVEKRINSKLSETAAMELIEIKNKSEDLFEKCGIAILIDAKLEYQTYLSKMDEDNRKNFLTYPICNLISQD